MVTKRSSFKRNGFKRRGLVIFASAALMMTAAALPALAEQEGDIRIPVGDDTVVFRLDSGDVEVWAINPDDYWDIVLRLSEDDLDEIDDSPESTELVASYGDIKVYRSPNGEWSVSNGPDDEGKTRVAVFDEDFFYSHEYEVNPYAE
jgi:hypothetical protein